MNVKLQLWTLFSCLLGAFASNCFGDSSSVCLHSRVRRLGETYEWNISTNRLLKSPRWNALKEEIPLSPHKASQIAQRWTEERVGDAIALLNVSIRPFPGYKDVYYYIFEYQVGVFDAMSCVILTDGSVVEPSFAKLSSKGRQDTQKR